MESQLCRLLHSLPYALLLLLSVAFRCAVGTQATSLRGVAPSKLHAYQNRSVFTCTSDQREVSIERVNDDVCDCADGSDEPGTSACANGTFHCRNKGFMPRELPSTFVDDGICDCCDGTDETRGCNDSCEALGQFARSDAQAKLRRYVAGAKGRDELLSEAVRKMQGWKERSTQLEETVGRLKPLVAQLYAEMEEAQRLQREAEEADKAKKSEHEQTDDSEEESVDDQAHAEPDADGVAEPEEDNGDAVSFDADAEARRIASQWTSDPDAAGNTAPGEGMHDADRYEPIDASAAEDSASDASEPKTVLERLADTVRSLGKAVWSPRTATVKSAQEQLVQLTRASKQAVQNHTAKKHELRTAETELKTLKGNLARDYGLGSVYAALHDVCLEIPKDQYRYRVCGFSKAAQVEGSSEVSLGTFNRCEDGCSSMFFTQGQTCWQGPARSIQVKLQCGIKNEIVSVEEPERCVYVAVMNSPAECTQSLIQSVRDELRQYGMEAPPDIKDEL